MLTEISRPVDAAVAAVTAMPKRRTSASHYNHHARYGRVSRCTTTYGYANVLWHSLTNTRHRFGKVHGSRIVTVWAAQHVLVGVPAFQRTPFAQVMPEQYRQPDAVASLP